MVLGLGTLLPETKPGLWLRGQVSVDPGGSRLHCRLLSRVQKVCLVSFNLYNRV